MQPVVSGTDVWYWKEVLLPTDSAVVWAHHELPVCGSATEVVMHLPSVGCWRFMRWIAACAPASAACGAHTPSSS